MKSLTWVLVALLLLTTGCIGPGRHPHGFLPPIAEEYYVCEKCGSLHGGIYGKGPLASFESSGGAQCWHRWHQITKGEFQAKAKDGYPSQWEKAIPSFKASSAH